LERFLKLFAEFQKSDIMKPLAILLSILFASQFLNANDSTLLPKRTNTAFQEGERLKFELYYSSWVTGNVTAGEMVAEINKRKYIVRNDTTYNIKVVGKTKGTFNVFYKVKDVYQTFIDINHLVPRFFLKRVREGNYSDSRDVHFYHEEQRAKVINNKRKDTGNVFIQNHVQDLISAIYYARTFNSDTINVNDPIPIDFFLDREVYRTKLVYLGKETIKTSIGKVRCLKFKPYVLVGSVFKDEDKLMVYISDDDNHLPIKAESEIAIGSVSMELIEYKNLRNPFSSLIE
jgi:hypothetical protein